MRSVEQPDPEISRGLGPPKRNDPPPPAPPHTCTWATLRPGYETCRGCGVVRRAGLWPWVSYAIIESEE